MEKLSNAEAGLKKGVAYKKRVYIVIEETNFSQWQLIRKIRWLFGYVGKRPGKKGRVNFKNLWRHKLGTKHLQHTYCPISQKDNETWSVSRLRNNFFKGHAENEVSRLVSNKLCKISDFWSRDMLNFDFLKKGLGLVSLPHFWEKYFWCYILLTDQILLSDCFYFLRHLRYWGIYNFRVIKSSQVFWCYKPSY